MNGAVEHITQRELDASPGTRNIWTNLVVVKVLTCLRIYAKTKQITLALVQFRNGKIKTICTTMPRSFTECLLCFFSRCAADEVFSGIKYPNAK